MNRSLNDFLKLVAEIFPWIFLVPGLADAIIAYLLELFRDWVGTLAEFLDYIWRIIRRIIDDLLKKLGKSIPKLFPGDESGTRLPKPKPKPSPMPKPFENPFPKPIHHSGGRFSIMLYFLAFFYCVSELIVFVI